MPNPTPSDAATGFQVGPALEAFAQRNNIYRRSFRGATVHSAKTRRCRRACREPQAHDAPQVFGVRAFSDICRSYRSCGEGCPVKAIAEGPPGRPPAGPSYIQGMVKWTVDAPECLSHGAQQNTDCAICIPVCPCNRDHTRPSARRWQWLAGTRWQPAPWWKDGKAR